MDEVNTPATDTPTNVTESAVDRARTILEEMSGNSYLDLETTIRSWDAMAYRAGLSTNAFSNTLYDSFCQQFIDNPYNWTQPKPEPTQDELNDSKDKHRILLNAIDAKRAQIYMTRPNKMRVRLYEENFRNIRHNSTRAVRELTSRQTTPESFNRYIQYLHSALHNISGTVEDEMRSSFREKVRSRYMRIANTPDTRSWLFCPIGIEYTFHAKPVKSRKLDKERDKPWYRRVENNRDTAIGVVDTTTEATLICERLQTRIKEIELATGNVTIAKAYVDSGCVEVCSPVHRNWRSMQQWYRWMISELGTSVTAASRKKGSGGAHINCSIPKKQGMRFMYNLMVDLGNRPYINWIFNEPSDNHTACCMWESKDMQRVVKFVEDSVGDYNYSVFQGDIDPATESPWDYPEEVDIDFNTELRAHIVNMDSRNYAIRVKDENHFEFRCFDAIRNERDLKDIIMFVSAYCRRIYKVTMNGGGPDGSTRLESIGGNTGDLAKFDRVARKEFNDLLRILDLDPKNYTRFIERNFYVRRKIYGKKHLV